jgi:hypothetical protein
MQTGGGCERRHLTSRSTAMSAPTALFESAPERLIPWPLEVALAPLAPTVLATLITSWAHPPC